MGLFKRFTRPRAKLSVTMEKRELVLGQELKGAVKLVAEEEFDIGEITVSLRCWESIKKTRKYPETRSATGEEEWREEEYWDEEKLYSEAFQVCNQMHVTMGFNKDFPFSFQIPISERETYHGADRKVEWLVSAYMKIMGRRHMETRGYEMLISKPSVLLKEVVREVVLIPCAYCGGLMPQTSTFCPNCGARRKA